MAPFQPTTIMFKDDHPLDKRRAEAERIRVKYPDRIPVICERTPGSYIYPIDKKKYLVPSDLSMGQFMFVIRKRIAMDPDKGLHLFVKGDTMVQTSALMSEMYDAHRDEDGFLYINYSGENTFG
ncbi:unnamed protein product [Choristocarpus tenellus]